MSVSGEVPGGRSSALYALPVPGFFSQCGGIGGHVGHVHGIIRAMSRSGLLVTAVAEEKPPPALLGLARWSTVPCERRGTLGRLIWGRRFRASVGTLVRKNRPGFLYLRYSAGFAPMLPRLRRILASTPLVVELNSFGSQRGRVTAAILSRWERDAILAADLVVCVTDTLREDVVKLLGRECASRCVTIPNGVDVERFCADIPPRSDGPLQLCYCGVLKSGYGLEDLFNAQRVLRERGHDVELNVIGDGPHGEVLRRGFAEVPGVRFHGAIGFDGVPSLLARMDVLLHATRPALAFQSPIKLYEYMSATKPIVAARTPQTEKLLGGDPACGLLYDCGDIVGLADAIAGVQAAPDRAEAMARRARAQAEAYHDWSDRLRRILEALEERGGVGG